MPPCFFLFCLFCIAQLSLTAHCCYFSSLSQCFTTLTWAGWPVDKPVSLDGLLLLTIDKIKAMLSRLSIY